MNIYISNLRSAIGNEELKQLFAVYGDVKSAEISLDLFTGQSRGFGYVEMEDDEAAKNAIASLHKTQIQELTISVEEAPVRKELKGSYKVGNPTVQGYKFRKN